MRCTLIPDGMSPLATIPDIALDVVFVSVMVYVAATPALTGDGTDTVSIPVGDEVALSASADGTPMRNAATTASIVGSLARPR
jgi:hypothetical protein